jgi:hypothetical protein
VFVGHIGVPKDNVGVLGRYQLKVIMPPDKGLEEILSNPLGSEHKVPVNVYTPGYGVLKAGELFLKSSAKQIEEPPYIIIPDKGNAGNDVRLSIKGRDMTTVEKVRVGGAEINVFHGEREKDGLVFTIPSQGASGGPGPVSISVYFEEPGAEPKEYYAPNAFTYIK